ncbi:MAG: hypothetical protein HC867_04370 [Bacteroidia bacterium]|nr:hypothetical protein [Bacteroidia bacterium]
MKGCLRRVLFIEGNIGDDQFQRYTFDGYKDGRWMTMEAGDMDGDGDLDIILGSALFGFGEVPESYTSRWREKRVSVCVLENRLKTADVVDHPQKNSRGVIDKE